ncbi:MAG TPA: gfo/Idh/MocA family oxidoreductase, partial [Clostridiales bacterium]|nr:gfo/Idh/MocA family oxidoreductase [Clostridiales bacterium]
MITVAMIGFGGIAKAAHFPVYKKLEKEGIARVVAIADLSDAAFGEGAAINIGGADAGHTDGIAKYRDYREMIEKERPDMVDICVPTDRHAKVACDALRAGCHVLSEKPMSLCYGDCLTMIRAAKDAGKHLMVAQCLRFSKKYGYLKEAVLDGRFGKIRAGVFRRLSAPPVWGSDNWYMDYNRSHGCILDLHIHDVDMIRYLCGEPISVSCRTQDIVSHMEI